MQNSGMPRRTALAIGAGLLAGPGPARAQIRAADVAAPRLPAEPGARLRVLRPAKFVEPDEAIFNANSRRFTERTGIEVRVDYVNWPDMPVQVAVAFNTGQGPDVIIGFSADPHLYADKVRPMTELSDYLGRRYGGWYDLALAYGRKYRSNDWLGVPMDHAGFLRLCQGLKRIGKPCGFALSHAPGDAPAYANWLLWSHGASLVDEEGKVSLESENTLRALDYARAMQETMVSGTMAWDGASNNRAFIAGDLWLTQNGVSIYYATKTANDARQNAIAADIQHADMPHGVAGRAPSTALTLMGMVPRYARFPNAATDYLRFMMEAEQYDPWLTGCLGYWSQPLKAYADSAVWSSDPRIAWYRTAMDTPFYEGYRGPISAATGAVNENWVVVDMFARVVTGQSRPADSMRDAARAARRWYRS